MLGICDGPQIVGCQDVDATIHEEHECHCCTHVDDLRLVIVRRALFWPCDESGERKPGKQVLPRRHFATPDGDEVGDGEYESHGGADDAHGLVVGRQVRNTEGDPEFESDRHEADEDEQGADDQDTDAYHHGVLLDGYVRGGWLGRRLNFGSIGSVGHDSLQERSIISKR